MNSMVVDWLNLLIRWAHLIAGIWWIGSSLYFVWLDNSFEPPKEPRDGVDGETFMVHGGFYYLVEKRLMQPGKMPEKLHWFKWEATFTWITGMMLLSVVYYLTGGAYLIDKSVRDISVGQAIGLSLAAVFVSWFVYDLLWQTLGKKSEAAGTALTLVMGVGLAYALCQTFSGRAAYIHMGAIMGTIMVANVWIRILPGQQKMLDDALAGKTPDYSQGKFAKVRSVHNSYMTFPVLFIMISNHYPMTYAHSLNWVVLLLMTVFGAGIRHYQITAEKHQPAHWVALPTLACFAALLYMTMPAAAPPSTDSEDKIPMAQVQMIITQRCTPCHATEPTLPILTDKQRAVVLETPEQIRAQAEAIKQQSVDSKAMPFGGNPTEMTDEEREIVGRWIAQQK